MSLRPAIVAGLAILGIALVGIWLFAPSVFTEAQRMLSRANIEALASGGRF